MLSGNFIYINLNYSELRIYILNYFTFTDPSKCYQYEIDKISINNLSYYINKFSKIENEYQLLFDKQRNGAGAGLL